MFASRLRWYSLENFVFVFDLLFFISYVFEFFVFFCWKQGGICWNIFFFSVMFPPPSPPNSFNYSRFFSSFWLSGRWIVTDVTTIGRDMNGQSFRVKEVNSRPWKSWWNQVWLQYVVYFQKNNDYKFLVFTVVLSEKSILFQYTPLQFRTIESVSSWRTKQMWRSARHNN